MKHFSFLIFSFFFVVGCGQNGAKSSFNSSSIECTDDNCLDGQTFPVKVQKVEGIVSQRQLLPNFQKCLDLPSVSATSRAAFNDSLSNLSQEGKVADLSAPLMMAVTKVTSELCTDRINLEKTQSTRKFFSGYNLGGTVTNSEPFIFEKTINTLAVSCLGRALTDAETKIIKDEITETRKDSAAALFVCTAILSSVQAIRY